MFVYFVRLYYIVFLFDQFLSLIFNIDGLCDLKSTIAPEA